MGQPENKEQAATSELEQLKDKRLGDSFPGPTVATPKSTKTLGDPLMSRSNGHRWASVDSTLPPTAGEANTSLERLPLIVLKGYYDTTQGSLW